MHVPEMKFEHKKKKKLFSLTMLSSLSITGRTQDSPFYTHAHHVHRNLGEIEPIPLVDKIDAEKVQDEASKDVICKCSLSRNPLRYLLRCPFRR